MDRFLCVREKLADGSQVVLVLDRCGAPRCCWVFESLPPSWRQPSRWHPSGVSVLTITEGQPLPTGEFLEPGSPEEMERWLARSYSYLRPLLGGWSVCLSSFTVFHNSVRAALKGLPVGGRLLEIGGLGDAWVTQREALSVCLDPAAHVGSSGRGFVRREVPWAVPGLVEELPFRDASFDGVVCLFVLEHLIEPCRALQEMSRVLKRGGFLLLALPVSAQSEGEPPLFHRWRFTSACHPDSSRTRLLEEIKPERFGLKNALGASWRCAIRHGDARLYWFVRD